MTLSLYLNGLKVILDSSLTDGIEVDRPFHRFIEYGPEDDWWLIKYMGCAWRHIPSKTAYQIGDTLIIHPDTWEMVNRTISGISDTISKTTQTPTAMDPWPPLW